MAKKKKKKGGKAAAKGRAAAVSASRVKGRKTTRATYKAKRTKTAGGGR